MQTYVARRLLQAIPVLLLITFLVFFLEQLIPGDPVYALIGSSGGQELAPSVIRQYRKEFHLDDPIPVQYAIWLEHALHGDLGKSIKSQRPVTQELRARIPVTLQLGLAALVIGLVVAFPLGITAALFRNTLLDRAITVFSIAAISIPGFFLAILLIILFAVKLRWLPASGFTEVTTNPVQAIKLLILPAFVLSAGSIGGLTRFVRSSLLEVLRADYVRTARAKGLPGRRVIWLHALKNAMLPVATIIGLQIGFLLAGALIIEQIFAIPGIGRYVIQGFTDKDFPVVQGYVLLVAICILAASLLTDLMYAVLDPRIRYR
ncbi:MAG TPA: ABC transporter permease [Dehalococcoidia bacterium]|nr:ABC transporter permease [Dehalococcoidia bacterium]